MVDQNNNNNKTAVPTVPSLIPFVYTGVFLGSVDNWRDVLGYQESSKTLYHRQHESDRKGRIGR